MCWSVSLGSSYFPSPSVEQSEEKRLLTQRSLSCLHSLWCLHETGMGWERLGCSQLRARVLSSKSVWSLPWWVPTLDCCGLCCNAGVCLLWWLDPWDFIVWMADLKVITLDWVSQNSPSVFIFLLLVAFSNMGRLVCICSMNWCVHRESEYSCTSVWESQYGLNTEENKAFWLYAEVKKQTSFVDGEN